MQHIEGRVYAVKGNVEQVYYVNLDDEDAPCVCHDAKYHGRGCLHELAARLQEREEGLVEALGEMLLRQQRVSENI